MKARCLTSLEAVLSSCRKPWLIVIVVVVRGDEANDEGMNLLSSLMMTFQSNDDEVLLDDVEVFASTLT